LIRSLSAAKQWEAGQRDSGKSQKAVAQNNVKPHMKNGLQQVNRQSIPAFWATRNGAEFGQGADVR